MAARRVDGGHGRPPAARRPRQRGVSCVCYLLSVFARGQGPKEGIEGGGKGRKLLRGEHRQVELGWKRGCAEAAEGYGELGREGGRGAPSNALRKREVKTAFGVLKMIKSCVDSFGGIFLPFEPEVWALTVAMLILGGISIYFVEYDAR